VSEGAGGSRALVIRTASEAETRAVGTAFARALPGGVTLSLEGPLGAGKTVFVRGLAEGMGVAGPVTSPTYTLENEYRGAGGRRLVHLDCFRLSGPGELEDLGVEERRDEDTIVVVEWGDRVLEALPPDTVRVQIGPDPEEPDDPEGARRIAVELPPGVELAALDPTGRDA
jgi:tRNA threonylcarbamoyladenosine biosynthesis protein TsaE